MPKVSVVIPNYNHARFLTQRINSVLRQSFQDFELIILDDASTDNSVEIIDCYREHPLVKAVCLNSKNSGSVFKQWNAGVEMCSGEYVWVAESDDYAEPEFLQTLVDVLDADREVGVAYCQSWRVDANSEIISDLNDWTSDIAPDRWRSDFKNDGKEECRNFLVLKCTIPNASAVVFRRFVFDKVGGADEQFRLAGDWMFWAKMLVLSNVAYIAKPLNYFRVHDGTVRASASRSSVLLHETVRVVEFICQNVEIPRDKWESVLERILDRWITEISRNGIRSSVNLELYRIIRRLDDGFHKRVWSRAWEAVKKKAILTRT